MSPADDPFVGWGGEPDETGAPQAAGPGGPARRRGWWSRYGRNLIVFIVVLAAVLSLAASLASIGPWAPGTKTTPTLGTTAPVGTTSPSVGTSQSVTTPAPGAPPDGIVQRIPRPSD
jgi:hypothetical protein